MAKIHIDKQELKLLRKIYNENSLLLSLDIPPTKSLLDKNLIERCSVCNQAIDGMSNYFYFRLADSCRKYLSNIQDTKNITYVKIRKKKQSVQNKSTKYNKVIKIIFIDILIPIFVTVIGSLIFWYITKWINEFYFLGGNY